MAQSIVIPQLGESVVEGTVAKWLKAEGDAVKLDEPIVEIATDKISIEIPAPVAGTLGPILVGEGVTLPVGTQIGSILAVGEVAGAAAPAPAPDAAVAAPAPAAASAPAAAPGSAPAAPPTPVAAPAPAPAAAAAAMPAPVATAAVPSNTNGSSSEPQRTSPAVRRLSREHNVDLARIAGSGAGGRVTKDDVLAFVAAGGAGSAAARPAAAPAPAAMPSYAQIAATAPASVPQSSALEEVVPMTTIRKKIAEAMVRSKYTAPDVTTFDEVEMTAVAELRKRWKSQLDAKGIKLTYTPFFIKAAAMALREWPLLNASVVGDNIVYKKYYNIGVAVGSDRGLIVPVIKDCDKKTIVEIARDLEDLGARAHLGKVTMDEISGGTFSVTNAGGFGAKSSTPIIAYPEVAILGVHAIEQRAVVRNGEVVARLMSTLVVTFDHRVIDGHIAVQFLRRICEFLENPELMVVGV